MKTSNERASKSGNAAETEDRINRRRRRRIVRAAAGAVIGGAIAGPLGLAAGAIVGASRRRGPAPKKTKPAGKARSGGKASPAGKSAPAKKRRPATVLGKSKPSFYPPVP
jgi:hypothetical protein